MKDLTVISPEVAQHKGCVHMHTDRSVDSQYPYALAAEEYRSKGFHFCVMTDHEVYWDSRELDKEDFFVLSGAERAMLWNNEHPYFLKKDFQKAAHFNLIWDETAGPNGFSHDEDLPRPVDWGISSWNRYIRDWREKNQLVIFNHPGWSHMDPELMLATEGCFAFEVWNTGSVKDVGGLTDDAIWDYCLERGKRIWAVAGDDTHKYGPDYGICGSCATVALTNDFSRKGLITALKSGNFYPTTGPEITAMEIRDGRLKMEFSPAQLVQVIGGNRWGTSIYAQKGIPLTSLDWEIKPAINYLRVCIIDDNGNIAWSQPVFMEDLAD